MIPLFPQMVNQAENLAVVDWEPFKHAEIYKVAVRAAFGTAEISLLILHRQISGPQPETQTMLLSHPKLASLS